MLWILETGQENRPRYYLNGFPKAGLHLLALMMSPAFDLMPSSRLDPYAGWLGTFAYHSWTNDWKDERLFTQRMARLQPGHYFKGHAGYRAKTATYLEMSGIAHVFIYRDLRDVAVSQAYHILNTDGVRFKHPAKHAYTALGDFDAILAACIEGLGPFPGVIERWEQYAGWLDCEWAHAVRFEDLRAGPEQAAAGILEYGIDRTLAPFRDELNIRIEGTLFEQMANEMAERSQRTELSPTFRKGQVGGWQESFTDAHKRLFKAHGGGRWLIELGYETDEEW